MSKTNLKQFLTNNFEVLRPFVEHYTKDLTFNNVLDPFSGEKHLLRLFSDKHLVSIDIDPDMQPDIIGNSLENIPSQPTDTIVITNPPYSHQHILQKQDPILYELVSNAGYTDLYEFAIHRVLFQCPDLHVFALMPENFIASRTTKLRREVCDRIRAVQIHEISTCETTDQPTILVYFSPSKVQETDLWIGDKLIGPIKVGPDGFRPNIVDSNNYVDFGTLDKNQSEECLNTSILLQATDGGSFDNRIKLMRVFDYFPNQRVFRNVISDRAYIQIVPRMVLSEDQIAILINRFNEWVDNWRVSTYGLGLTSFRSNVTRNGVTFRRKRIDFKLARLVINNIISSFQQ